MRRLTEQQLAERWQLSVRTLQNWRWQGKGPRYLKIGARVLYPAEEVDAHETGHLHANTTGPLLRERG